MPVSLDFMSVSSYGDDTKSSGVVRIVKDLDQPLEGKEVLIVEDIIDSGRTLYYLIDILKKEKSEIRTPVYSARQAGAQSARCQSRLYLL